MPLSGVPLLGLHSVCSATSGRDEALLGAVNKRSGAET
jgi:hypothetical protein